MLVAAVLSGKSRVKLVSNRRFNAPCTVGRDFPTAATTHQLFSRCFFTFWWKVTEHPFPPLIVPWPRLVSPNWAVFPPAPLITDSPLLTQQIFPSAVSVHFRGGNVNFPGMQGIPGIPIISGQHFPSCRCHPEQYSTDFGWNIYFQIFYIIVPIRINFVVSHQKAFQVSTNPEQTAQSLSWESQS